MTYDFDHGLDAQVRIVSTAPPDRPLVRPAGGNPGGYLALTDARSQTATLVFLPNLSGSHPVKSFQLTADIRVGNGTSWATADGFSISLASPDDPVFTAADPAEGYPGRMDNNAEDLTIPTVQVPAAVGRLLETHRTGLRLSIGRDENPVLSEITSGGQVVRNEFALLVSRPGFYPLRLVHYTVQDTGMLEWMSITGDGNSVLINDRSRQGALRAHALP